MTALIVGSIYPSFFVALALLEGDGMQYSQLSIVFIFGFITTFTGLVFLGLPSIYMVSKRFVINYKILISIGAFTGIIAIIIFVSMLAKSVSLLSFVDLKLIAFGSVFGATASCLYGMISGITRRSN